MKNLENNKLIAEFMGIKQGSKNYNLMSEGFMVTVIDRTKASCIADELRFNISWDWLMPVVDKIEVIQKEMDCETIIQTGAKIWAKSNNKLEGTYKAVVEFIKWYNKNK